MALTRPSLPENTIMDALRDNIIVFESYGGDRVTGYDVEIYNNETNVLAYTVEESNIASNRIAIQANALSNGIVYRIRIHTYNEQGDYSDWSDYGLLTCYTTPVCSIDNLVIDGDRRIVPSQNYIFMGSYQQSQGIAIQKYQYVLYDSEKTLIQALSPVVSSFIVSNNELSQRIEGFEPSVQYYIELKCTDANGLEVSSGLVLFTAEYEIPRIRQIVELENEAETASVKISSDMIQIIFKIEDGETPVYVNEQELMLYKTVGGERVPLTAYVDEYLNIPADFTLKVYCRNIPRKYINQEEYFLTIISADGLTKIQMKEYDNRIHVYKTTTPKPSGADIRGHYVSNVIEGYVPNESYVVIQINQSDGRLDVFAEVTDMVA